MTDLIFDRVVSESLLRAVRPGGNFDTLIERRNLAPTAGLDVQLRRDQRGSLSWASLMLGLTNVLDLMERNGNFWLRASPTHQIAAGFNPAWSEPRPGKDLGALRTEVQGYLDLILGTGGVASSHVSREGKVQAAMCSMTSDQYGVVQREAAVSFSSQTVKDRVVLPLATEIWRAVQAATPPETKWWPGIRDRGAIPSPGTETDVLALDTDGRLLVIEVKPAEAIKGLAWGPAQVRLYAELFASWINADEELARTGLNSMASQRQTLGLLDAHWRPAVAELRVLPVLAIGPGRMSSHALPRIKLISEALADLSWSSARIDPFEVWLMDHSGVPTERFTTDQIPYGSGTVRSTQPPAASFVSRQRASAAAWKASSSLLPEEARVAAPYENSNARYPFVLRAEDCWLNLLPEARDVARTRFAAASIRWHSGGDKPSSHLLSSQVQCVNALAPFAQDPDALATIFGGLLPIDVVVPFGAATASPYDASDHVVFEWPGLASHLNEWPSNQKPTRGAYATSADAALRYLTPDGDTEIALIEWKYTEHYPDHGPLKGDHAKQAARLSRYREMWADPASPIRNDQVPYEAMFAEPVYQLFRTQLMAWKVEQARELGATRVRFVYAAPSENDDLLKRSLGTSTFAEGTMGTGGSLVTAWQSVLRRPDRFVSLDTLALLTGQAPTSGRYKARYGQTTAGGDAGFDAPR